MNGMAFLAGCLFSVAAIAAFAYFSLKENESLDLTREHAKETLWGVGVMIMVLVIIALVGVAL